MGRDASKGSRSDRELLRMRKKELNRRLEASRESLKRSVGEGRLSEEDTEDIFTHSRVAWTMYYAQLATLDDLRSASRKHPFLDTHGKP